MFPRFISMDKARRVITLIQSAFRGLIQMLLFEGKLGLEGFGGYATLRSLILSLINSYWTKFQIAMVRVFHLSVL